jgi:hypothetical protein
MQECGNKPRPAILFLQQSLIGTISECQLKIVALSRNGAVSWRRPKPLQTKSQAPTWGKGQAVHSGRRPFLLPIDRIFYARNHRVPEVLAGRPFAG